MFTNISRPSVLDTLTPFAVGDLFYADTTSSLAKRGIGSSNQALIVTGGLPVWSSNLSLTSLTLGTPLATTSGGTGVNNATGSLSFDSAVNLTDSGTIDLNGWIASIPASGTFAIQEAANIFSGGVTLTTANLTITDVNIALSTSTGTKIGTATTQKLSFYNATPIARPTGDLITAITSLGLVGSPTISATTLTGIVPSANGGTGVNNAGTITNASNTTITGGGTLVLGGFTLTVPATGTTALLAIANNFTAVNTFSNTTDASAIGTAAVILSGGLSVAKQLRAAGNTTIGDGSALINLALNGAAATSRDIRFQTAGSLRWFMGADSTAESGSDAGSNFFLTARTDTGSNIDSPIQINRVTAGTITLGGSTGRQVSVTTTTDATTSATGSVVTAGGIGIAKSAIAGTGFGVGVAPTSSVPLNLSLTVAGSIAAQIKNSSASTAAQSQFTVFNDGSKSGTLGITSSGFTPIGILAPSTSFLYGDATGGLAICANNASSFISFSTAGTAEIARFSNAKNLLIGTTSDAGITGAGGISAANTTDATSSTTGSVITSGGLNVAKNILHRQGRGAGFATNATLSGTVTLTSASKEIQTFTGSTAGTVVQFPAANLFGASISVLFTINNQSTQTVTPTRAGSDTFQGGGTTDAVVAGATTRYASDGVSVWMKI